MKACRLDKAWPPSWPRALLGLVLWMSAVPAMADYVDGWGPALGSFMPPLEAVDETGTVRTLEDLSGDQGLLLFLNRSADW